MSRTSALAATLVGLVFLSCSPSAPTDPGQTQGQIQVSVSTSGTGVPSSFTVTLNGGSSRPVSPDGSVTFGSLNPGNYMIELSVPGNCTISGSAERSVGVQESSTSTVAYSVTCSAVPTGAIGVTTSTTGSPADPDGYTVSIDGGAARAIGVNDNLLIPDLGLGDHEVELSGVADNCLVQGANPRTVSVSENRTTPTEFEVTCSATTGRIDVTVTTTGPAQDADGYVVDLDAGAVTRDVDTNGSVEFTGVEQGEHTLTLDDVASNCTVMGDNPASVDVVAGETVAASFTVTCEATTGSLEVSAATSGDELDPNGYAVSVDGSLEQTIGVNGTTTFVDLPPGDHEVELTGVASNCAVAGDNPRTVAIVAGATASTNFDATCSSTVGSIEVTVTTTGEAIDADGYSVVLDGGASTQLVDANDTIVFGGLAPGEHTLDLGNVAGNCTVTSANPATADVTAGAQTDVAFTVQCEQLTGDIQVNMSTTGAELDPNGYTVSLDGGSGLSVAINGSRTFSDVVIGEHEIQIDGVASNCAVQGSNPRTVNVNENATTQVDFDVECSATAGQIEVTVTTTGEDLDPNGYTVDLDGTSSEAVATNGTTTFTGVSEGSHTLTLQNIATNCTATSPNPTSTNVTAGQTSNVSFTVECTRTTGDIRVTTSSTGSPPDPNGYTVSVDGGAGRAIGNNDEELFLDLQPGGHTVTLSDLALNCSVVGSEVRNVTVNANQETVVAYSIECVPLEGDLRVNVSTTGQDLDPDGYEARLDGNPGTDAPVGINGFVTFVDVSTGSHSVTLVDVANNCEIVGPDSKSITVVFDTTVDLDFDVTCVGLTGDLTVNTSTTGDELDLDGYTVTVDGGSARSIGIIDTETFLDVADGDHTVELSGVAGNCTASGSNPRTVSVPADGTGSTTFVVTCEATTGSIAVDVSTTGEDLDPNGYTITRDGGDARSVGINGSTTYSGLAPGDYDIGISGVANNCTVSETNPQTTSVTAGATTNIGFTVTCVGLTGDLTVNTSTTGDELDPDGYTVTVDGGSARSIGINDTETFLGVADGVRSVLLNGVADNCALSGANPRNVNVPAGGANSTTFVVTCEATTGSVAVDVSTTGEDLDPNGYTITRDGANGRSVGINGSTTYSGLAPGDYDIGISGVASNCTVSETNPQTASVTAGATTNIGFTVTCVGLTGDLTVNTSTTGDELDPDGYTVTVDGGSARSIGIIDTETFLDVADGDHTVELSGVAGNCTASGSNPRTVSVPADGTGSTTFVVTCEATTGSIMVTTTTTGTPDPDGYFVALDGGTPAFIDDGTPVPFNDLSPTSHTVELSGLDGTCAVVAPPSNPATPTVIAGDTVPVDFNVDCP